jgi:hypothetical protein
MRQISKSQRRLAAGAFLIIAAPIVATSVAYACQTLATLHANPRSTTAGSTVQVRGTNYSSNASSTPIEIRLDGRTGRLLASFTPRSTLVNENVVIPADVAAGTHTLLATQYTSGGNAVGGTPGRASLVITVAARTSSDGATAAPVATASTDSGAAAPVAATPAEVTSAAQTAPATSGGAAAATQAAPATPAAAAATNSIASAPSVADGTTPAGPAAPTAPAAAAPAAAAETASAAGPASVNVGLLPASATDSSSSLPGLALAAGLAMVLLALGAFIKTGRNMLGRGTTPLAG